MKYMKSGLTALALAVIAMGTGTAFQIDNGAGVPQSGLVNAPAQTPAGWRTYDSPLYSFPYPSAWTIQQQNQNGGLSLNSPNFDPPAFEIGYAGDFRGDIDSFLAAEREGMKALAQQLNATIQFHDAEMGPRGGREVSGDISKPGSLSLIATSLAMAIDQLLAWLGLTVGKFCQWRQRYGKTNQHNGGVPRDFWLQDWEKKPILDFQELYPSEGYRRLTYMMMDRTWWQ